MTFLKNLFGILLLLFFFFGIARMFYNTFDANDYDVRTFKIKKIVFFMVVVTIFVFFAYNIFMIETTKIVLP